MPLKTMFLPAFACLLTAIAACQSEPCVGVVLQYEVDESALPAGAKVDYASLTRAVEQRVNSDERRGRVRKADAKTLEIEVFGGEAQADAVKRLLAALGTLEFRIVANRHDHEGLISKAEALPLDVREVKNADGRDVGRWVRVEKAVADAVTTAPDLAVRNLNSGASEVLVVIDKFNVTGDYLTSVEAREVDRIPCIEFALNPRGAALFGGLTGANLPDVATGRERQLAIILDGVVHSVPNLRQTITDRGQITGQYTYQEVRDLVAALRSGALPAPLKLVGERTP